MITRPAHHARERIRATIPHRFRGGLCGLALASALVSAAPEAFAQNAPIASALPALNAERDSDDPFADGSWQLDLSGHSALEAWNYNISHEEMHGGSLGLTYAVRNGLALTASAPLYYVAQRGTDAWLIGATFGVRGRIYRRGGTSLFLGFDVGISEADTFVPPRGTRFNYLAIGSIGATLRIRKSLHALGALKWVHVSNNGLAGRHRNPDIEAMGPQIGILIGF